MEKIIILACLLLISCKHDNPANRLGENSIATNLLPKKERNLLDSKDTDNDGISDSLELKMGGHPFIVNLPVIKVKEKAPINLGFLVHRKDLNDIRLNQSPLKQNGIIESSLRRTVQDSIINKTALESKKLDEYEYLINPWLNTSIFNFYKSINSLGENLLNGLHSAWFQSEIELYIDNSKSKSFQLRAINNQESTFIDNNLYDHENSALYLKINKQNLPVKLFAKNLKNFEPLKIKLSPEFSHPSYPYNYLEILRKEYARLTISTPEMTQTYYLLPGYSIEKIYNELISKSARTNQGQLYKLGFQSSLNSLSKAGQHYIYARFTKDELIKSTNKIIESEFTIDQEQYPNLTQTIELKSIKMAQLNLSAKKKYFKQVDKHFSMYDDGITHYTRQEVYNFRKIDYCSILFLLDEQVIEPVINKDLKKLNLKIKLNGKQSMTFQEFISLKEINYKIINDQIQIHLDNSNKFFTSLSFYPNEHKFDYLIHKKTGSTSTCPHWIANSTSTKYPNETYKRDHFEVIKLEALSLK